MRSTKPRRVRTPVLLQMEAVECAATALGIVLAFHGKRVPASELRDACGISRNGSDAARMVKAAQRFGLAATGQERAASELETLPLPHVVHWNQNHFVVVEGYESQGPGAGRVHLNDPALGRRTVSREAFDSSYAGLVLRFEPGPDFQPGGPRRNLLRSLGSRLDRSRKEIGFLVISGLLLVVPGLAMPLASQIFIDQILIQRRFEWVVPFCLGLALLAVLRGAISQVRLHHLDRLKGKLAIEMSQGFLWHLLHLPMRFYTQRFPGSVAVRFSINSRLASILSGRLATSMIDLTMIGFYGAMMLAYERTLAGIAFTAAGLNLLVLWAIARKRQEANHMIAMTQGKVAGVSLAGIQNIEAIKASAGEARFFTRWTGYQARAVNASQAHSAFEQRMAALPVWITGLATAAIIYVGGLRVLDGQLTLGMLIAFQGMIATFLAPVNSLATLGATLQGLSADLSLLDDVLEVPSEATSRAPQDEPMSPLRGELAVVDLSFGYLPDDAPLVSDVSFEATPGERIALVGASGSGKSTVAKLVAGLYKPHSGSIRFDGVTLDELPDAVRAQGLAMVDQEIALFGATLRENLTLWDATIPEEDLLDALKDADLLEDVEAMPRGLDTPILEGGANLSGGQRQRLDLARALVSRPAVLILDEATSALDAESEATVMENLRKRGCTCLIVAHRLSAIRDCDQILVLSDGRIIERGTHETLLANQGAYARLLASELGATPSETAHA